MEINLNLDLVLKVFSVIIIAIILYLVLRSILKFIERKFLKKVKTKKEKSNIKIFFQIINYILIVIIILFIILSYSGSLTGIGISAGLVSAALGWALQRPITGMAAWIMVIIKRPFEIGDRVAIGGVKGDILDITLTHIHLGEIGGTIDSEENSGRMILIPNAKLFEQDIINYTRQDELILDQVKFTITFDSNIEKAEEIAKKSAKNVIQNYQKNFKEPYIRTLFQKGGIDVCVRYFIPASKREEISSIITEEILRKIQSSNNITLV